MADQEKKMRKQRLGNFTRSVKNFNKLYESNPPLDVLTTSYEKVISCWDLLEAAQDAYINAVVDETEELTLSR